MIERLETVFHRDLVPPDEVADHYFRLSPGGSKDVRELAHRLHIWTVEPLTPDMVTRGIFYYGTDIPPDHPDHLFTERGRVRNMVDVARKYLERYHAAYDDPASPLYHHWYLRNIRYFRDGLRSGLTMPHVVAVTGRVKKDLIFIDGNTRTMSAVSVWLEDGGAFPALSAYIGRKSFLQV